MGEVRAKMKLEEGRGRIGGTPGENRRYRLDVQGLRAIGVLSVVAFHAGLPLPGGFAGVDVFFVISGFVITAMLLSEYQRTGRIRFGRFYYRRFKRLTPALALMVSVVTVFGLLVLSPFGVQQVAAKTGLGALFISANWVIASETGGYFDLSAESNPLLNTWSLSVEEQFYLVFPALLLLAWIASRFVLRLTGSGRRIVRVGIAVVLVAAVGSASFALAVKGGHEIGGSWLLHFYSPLTRAWEFGAGALVVLLLPYIRRIPSWGTTAIGAGGVALVAAGFVVVSGETLWPGVATLLPVIGTVSLIIAGSGGSNFVTRGLAVRPMVLIGDWSYSIYLWHWPFIVFAAQIWPGDSIVLILAALVSLIPAIASFRFLENPIRVLPSVSRQRQAMLIAAVVLPAIVVVWGTLQLTDRVLQPRLEANAGLVAHEGDIGHPLFHDYIWARYGACEDVEMARLAPEWDGRKRCQQSKPGVSPGVVIVGDSHAEQLFPGVAEALPGANVAYYVNAESFDAPGTWEIVRHVAKLPSVKDVVISSHWLGRSVDAASLREQVELLEKSGKRVVITNDTPQFPFDPFKCKYKPALLLSTVCTMDAGTVLAQQRAVDAALQEAIDGLPGVALVDTFSPFCESSSCSMVVDDAVTYRDDNHLNVVGSRVVGRLVAAALARG